MWTLLFFLCMLFVFGKLFVIAVKMAWSLMKIVCWLLLLPAFLVILVLSGLFIIAVPILAIVGLFSLLAAA